MRSTLSSYALEGIEVVPADVIVDGDRARVVNLEIGRCLVSFKLRTTSPGDSKPEQSVNNRTLTPGRSAPADLKKDANGFDLPIALGLLLLASGQVAFDRPGDYAIVGELTLTGETGPSRVFSGWPSRPSPRPAMRCSCPRPTPPRPAVVEGLNVYPVGSLAEAVGFLTGQVDMDPEAVDLDELFAQHSHMEEDFVDVKGQDSGLRPEMDVLELLSDKQPRSIER